MTTVTQISRRHGKAPSSGESRAVPPIRSRVQSCPLCLAARQTRTWTPAAPSRCECQESVSEMPRVPEGGVSQRGRDFQRQGREGAGEAKAWRRARGGLSWKPPPPPRCRSVAPWSSRADRGPAQVTRETARAFPQQLLQCAQRRLWAGCPRRDLRRDWRRRGPSELRGPWAPALPGQMGEGGHLRPTTPSRSRTGKSRRAPAEQGTKAQGFASVEPRLEFELHPPLPPPSCAGSQFGQAPQTP